MIVGYIVDQNQSICYCNERKKIGIEHCHPDYLDKVLTEALLLGETSIDIDTI
jgi:hypothetical protein